jgi:hypothetical protein
VVWGCVGHERRLEEAERWYRALLEATGAETQTVVIHSSDATPT